MKNQRLCWAAGALFAALAAALLIGAAPAVAETGVGNQRPDTSAATSQKAPATGKAGTGKRRPTSATGVSRIARAIDSATVSRVPADLAAAGFAAAEATPDVKPAPVTAIRPAAPVAHKPPSPGPLAALVLNVLSGAAVPAPRPAAVAPVTTVGRSRAGAAASASAFATNGVTGVQVGHSDLAIPLGPTGYVAPADWYFPAQADGSVQARGVIWLQHGFLADKAYYSALATNLARNTNSVVVAPTLTSIPLTCAGCWLGGAAMHQAVATMFLGGRAALNISAAAAGYRGTLPTDFVVAGHSAGGGFAASVGGYYQADPRSDGSLRGVLMYDGVSMNGTLPQALQSLGGIPIYQIAAPAQTLNVFGITTDELLALRPTQFNGVVLVNGSHVDAMMGSDPLIDFSAQLFTRPSPAGNTAAVYTLSNGWINDFYAGAGPADPRYGLYGNAGQPIIMGPASAIVLPTPEVSQLSPLEQVLRTWTAALLPILFGGQPPAAAVGPALSHAVAA